MIAIGNHFDILIARDRTFSAHVTRITAKAVQLNNSVWLPLRALLHTRNRDVYQLASWFRPDFLTRAKLYRYAK